MPTDVTSTIGTTGRDYSTLQAWEDACPANLVTDDKRWIGNCYNDSEFTGGAPLTVGGITADSTRYLYLKCATGQSFSDNAGVRTNALYYNTSNGVAIRGTGGYSQVITISSVSYCRFEGLQIKCANTSNTFGFTGNVGYSIYKCIVEAGYRAVYGPLTGAFNCLIYGASSGYHSNGTSGSLYGCTIVNCTGEGVKGSGYDSAFLKNCAVFNNTTNFTGSNFGATGWCATDSGSVPGSGGNNQTSLTYANQFESTTNDFRAKSTGDLQAGTPDSTNTPDDITGLTRDATTPWIGCWEVAGSASLPQRIYRPSRTAVHRAANY